MAGPLNGGPLGMAQSARRRIVLAAQWTNSTTTPTKVDGLAFTPLANSTYLIEVFGVYTGAAAGVGLKIRLESGTATGGAMQQVRGASVTTTSESIGVAPGSTYTTDGATAAASGSTPFSIRAILVTTGSPTEISVYAASDLAANAATIAAGQAVMFVEKIA